MALNASITGITTRNSFLLWLLEVAAKMCGASIRLWRTRPRKEKA